MNSAVSSMTGAAPVSTTSAWAKTVTRRWMRNKSFPVSPTHPLVENTPVRDVERSAASLAENALRVSPCLRKIKGLSGCKTRASAPHLATV